MDSNVEVRFWTDKKFLSQSRIIFAAENIPVSTIISGKWRRYANLKWYHHFQHIFKTHLMNLLDLFKVGIGVVQSFFKLLSWWPDAIFVKGGYVGLPVGLATKILGIPLVVHDSDAYPGLTDRILSKWATKIGTGMPKKYYPQYPKEKTEFVGIPVRTEFYEKPKRKLSDDSLSVLAMGGGQGAKYLNNVILDNADELKNLARFTIITGDKNFKDATERTKGIKGFEVLAFVGIGLAKLVGSSDIIITRAGATALAELALLGSTVIIVPNPWLAADHQTKNAGVYESAKAAVVIDQRDLAEKLIPTIKELLANKSKRNELAKNLREFAQPDAAKKMAQMIIGVVNARVKK